MMTKLPDLVTVVVPGTQLVSKDTFSHLFSGVLW